MSKSKYKYKNGQAVRVRDDLVRNEIYYMRSGPNPDHASVRAASYYNAHLVYQGKIVHISHKANECYKILEDGKSYYYVDDMLESLKPFVCKSLL